MAAHSFGQVEAYLTVREILSEASTAADGVLSRERSDFGRGGVATLGFIRIENCSNQITNNDSPSPACCLLLYYSPLR